MEESKKPTEEYEWVKVDKNTMVEFTDGKVLPLWPFIEMEYKRARRYGEISCK